MTIKEGCEANHILLQYMHSYAYILTQPDSIFMGVNAFEE